MWYKQILISDREKQIIDKLFINLKFISIDNYANNNWKVLYFHSSPFMEEPIYEKFVRLTLGAGLSPVNIFCFPFAHNTTFLSIERMPENYAEFNELMKDTNFLYTGGFGYCQNEKLAFVSSADTEVFSIGYDQVAFASEIDFKNIPQLITKTQAKELTKAHLDFLDTTRSR